ncbi:MAG TPA: hypothetical protein VFL79_04600 [Terriglobia bacterium]|nr:hypothetical protein [Terriglobia bacterium]
MPDFQLFRVKVYEPPQRRLFGPEWSRSDFLLECIGSLSGKGAAKGTLWHLGNPHHVDDAGIYFRVGRISKSTVGLYQDGNFIDQEFEVAPYTHVLLDTALELCAIAKNAKLSPSPSGIARQLARLIKASDIARLRDVDVEISELSDPEDFIAHMREAAAIQKFWVTFSRPNPFDLDEDFSKPLQGVLTAVNGETGKAEIAGGDLDAGPLETVARSAAATGMDAGAVMVRTGAERKERRRLRENIVTVSEGEVDVERLASLLSRIRTIYSRIRGKTD